MPEPVVQTLGRLVGWPTVSNRPLDALAAHLAARAEAAGMHVTRFESAPGKANVVARCGPRGVGGLTLSGHMDVVPTDDQDWTSDPFVLTERDGRQHGRGTCDMKGFIAATLHAIDGLDLRKLEQELVLIWTHDEEVGCLGSALLAEQLQGEDRVLPTATVIGEPTDFRVLRLHPGHATFAVDIRGRSAHSSRPSLGLSAISLAVEAACAIEAWAMELAQAPAFSEFLDTPHTLVNLGRIQGGSAVNIVAERCTLEIGVRPLPGLVVDDLEQQLLDRLAALDSRARAAGGAVSLRRLQRADALLTSASCDHMALLQDCARRADRNPEPCGAPFATDGGNLARLGLEPLVFGPGSIDLAHRPDEYIETVDLLKAQRLVADLIHARCFAHPVLPAPLSPAAVRDTLAHR